MPKRESKRKRGKFSLLSSLGVRCVFRLSCIDKFGNLKCLFFLLEDSGFESAYMLWKRHAHTSLRGKKDHAPILTAWFPQYIDVRAKLSSNGVLSLLKLIFCIVWRSRSYGRFRIYRKDFYFGLIIYPPLSTTRHVSIARLTGKSVLGIWERQNRNLSKLFIEYG